MALMPMFCGREDMLGVIGGWRKLASVSLRKRLLYWRKGAKMEAVW